MSTNMVKWNKSNAMKLSWAVRKFNNTISKIETEENKLYLPEKIDYKDIKSNIFSSQNLKQTINNLNKFSNEKEQKIVQFNESEFLTNWEAKNLRREKKRAERRLTTELIVEQNENSGMRSGFATDRERELKATLKNIDKLDKLSKSEFKRLKNRLHNIGNKDYELKRFVQYRENYYTALKEIKNFENYKIYKQKLDSIKDPREFFNYIQQNEIMSDLFLWYKEGDGLVYGAFASNEDAFNSALEQLGLL